MRYFRFLMVLVLGLIGGTSLTSAQTVGCGDVTTTQRCVEEILPIGGVFTDPSWLRVTHHHVDVTIENQIAATKVDLEFVNEGNGLAEGTFVFPLPSEAAVDDLTMYIDGEAFEANILPADEARRVYDEIVRQHRDPALLEYIGMQAIQANVFPIPPGESRRIELRYVQALAVDNGLFHYTYPYDVTSLTSSRTVDSASIRVTVVSDDAISNVYSPSHEVMVSRNDAGFVAGWEASNYAPDMDFSLYYGITSDAISMNLLSYRESAREDGFFMLMVQPPFELDESKILPRDLIIVLDQSGSMGGEKWKQAQQAATYVLDQLNPRDRFNVVLFSTGWRLYSNELVSIDEVGDAKRWIEGMNASGATDIHGALTTAVEMSDAERNTTILFLTDGLATEGETRTDKILEQMEAVTPDNVRLFTFGVGNDVDTFLLDSLVSAHRGLATYVRPNQRIDEEVASLFNKMSAPVMTNIEIDFGDVMVETLYPKLPLPDLFAGTQLTIVGRYRDGAEAQTLRLTGEVDGERQTIIYDGLTYRETAGGDAFVARLWATRRIGDMLNTIRLHGENRELIDSVIDLSVKYGIITPYTSFLITEDDILSQRGRESASMEMEEVARDLSSSFSGEAAVTAADQLGSFTQSEAPFAPAAMPSVPYEADGGSQSQPVNPIKTVGAKTFILQDETWTDTTFDPDNMTPIEVVFLSDEYFALLDADARFGEYLAVGERVIVVLDDVAYAVVPA